MKIKVEQTESGHWVFQGHKEVIAAATDPEKFSSSVSRHVAIPNSLDGEEHRKFRILIDRYLTDTRVLKEEAQCIEHAKDIATSLPRNTEIEIIKFFGEPFAVRSQSEWLGWAPDLEPELLNWMEENLNASRSADYERTAAVAKWFDDIVHKLVMQRKHRIDSGDVPWDVTSELMVDTSIGRKLTEAEIVSILRNWTAGDLGSIASSIGVIVYLLAARPDIQRTMREYLENNDASAIEAGIDELLRIDDPFVSNRRITKCPVTVAGHEIPERSVIYLNWTVANRDPEVFADPDAWLPEENVDKNLVFGAGPHVCPGRSLTLMELRCAISELLSATNEITLSPNSKSERQIPPFGGWAKVFVTLH